MVHIDHFEDQTLKAQFAKMEKNGKSNTRFEDLPDGAVVKIFTRLPVKTLISSTSVCKKWYSLSLVVTKPKFFSAHIQHSLSCCNQNAVLIVPNNTRRIKYCSVLLADTCERVKNYKIPFKTKNGSLQLCGSFNGVLCLKAIGSNPYDNLQYQDLCLWNPCVGKYKILSASCFKKPGLCYYGFGFGVYEPTFDFRIVRVVYPIDDKEGSLLEKVPPKAEVYSLERHSWRRIKNPGVPFIGFLTGVTVGNNMTYWLNARGSRDFNQDEWLLSFDFNNEVFGKIKLPDSVRYCLGVKAKFKLLKVEGKLAVCVLNHIKESNGTFSQPCCIWLMSHDDGEISWNLRFKIVLEERMRPLSVSWGGTLLMVSYASPKRPLVFRNLMSEDLHQSKQLVSNSGCYVDSVLREFAHARGTR